MRDDLYLQIAYAAARGSIGSTGTGRTEVQPPATDRDRKCGTCGATIPALTSQGAEGEQA